MEQVIKQLCSCREDCSSGTWRPRNPAALHLDSELIVGRFSPDWQIFVNIISGSSWLKMKHVFCLQIKFSRELMECTDIWKNSIKGARDAMNESVLIHSFLVFSVPWRWGMESTSWIDQYLEGLEGMSAILPLFYLFYSFTFDGVCSIGLCCMDNIFLIYSQIWVVISI